MKKSICFLLLSLPLFTLWFCTSSSTGREKENSDPSHSGVINAGYKNLAILELFTSQGCSSCPAADRLLGTYITKGNIIALSYHVDYWDRLGWKDPFSSAAFTERQNNYASSNKSDVYTPQIIINGQTEMVGSNESKISATVKKVLEQEPNADISIKTVKPENGHVSINFVAAGNTANSVLNIALVQKKSTTEIEAGENRGVTLTNYNVVRQFKTFNRINNGDNTESIDMPADADQKNMCVIVFLQHKRSNNISAADQKPL